MAEPLDIADSGAFSERVDTTLVPGPGRFLIERHRPETFTQPYHHHSSVEINYLQGCRLTYSFSGREVQLGEGRLTLFWGGAPHRVTDVQGSGVITNLYLPLGQVLHWALPRGLSDALLTGGVLIAPPSALDLPLLDRLFEERHLHAPPWRQLHLSEVEARLRRIGLEGFSHALPPGQTDARLHSAAAGLLHVEAMLRYIADHFSRPIGVGDVVASVNLSPGHAGKLFRQMMGVSLKEQLTRTRLSHARMLLSDSNQKIVSVAMDCGYRSLSSFYDAFLQGCGESPGRYRRRLQSGDASAVPPVPPRPVSGP